MVRIPAGRCPLSRALPGATRGVAVPARGVAGGAGLGRAGDRLVLPSPARVRDGSLLLPGRRNPAVTRQVRGGRSSLSPGEPGATKHGAGPRSAPFGTRPHR